MPAGTFVIKDLRGNAPGTSPYVVNRMGTSQVLKIKLEGSFVGGEEVTLPLSLTANVGDATITAPQLPLTFTSVDTERLITVKGASTTGDFKVQLGPATSDGPASDFDAITTTVDFTNQSDQPVANNTASTEPTLHAPIANAAVSAASDVTFEWQHAYDRDADQLNYSLCFSSAATMTNMQCVSVDSSAVVSGSGVAGFDAMASTSLISSGLLVSMLVMFLWRRYRSPKISVVRRITFLGGVAIMSTLGLSACGNQNLLSALRVPPRPTVRAVVQGSTVLTPGTVYWRVYADDSKGNVTPSSETRMLTVQP